MAAFFSMCFNRVKGWYERNFTWRGVAALAWFLAKVIPDSLGRGGFWTAKLPILWKNIYAHSTFFTVVVVGLIIWLDHRRMVRRPQPAIDRSLKGRTLAFCDDLKRFQKELGPEPKINWTPGDSVHSFTEGNQGLIRREALMHHSFHMQFYDRAVRLWHEHGAEMRESQALADALGGRITDEKLNAIIETFTELASQAAS